MEVDRTMTNGICLEGHVMVPNLGYKKDTFLEPSLISNFLIDIPNITIPQLCLLLVTPIGKLVANPIQVLLRCHLPMVRLLGPIASFVEASKIFKSTRRLKERCCPGPTNNQPTL